MTCPKCRGLMVDERYVEEDAALEEWRCVNCGLRRFVGYPAAERAPVAEAATGELVGAV